MLPGRKAMPNLDSILKRRDITNKGPSSRSYGFFGSHAWMWELDHKECWVPKSWCFWTVVLKKSLESPLDCKEIKGVILKKAIMNIDWKDWCWSWSSNTVVPWCEELTHWEIPWCWERLKAGGEGDNRGCCGWMASLTQWTLVWEGSGSWWWTGKPGILQSKQLQRAGHNWATELNWKAATEGIHLSLQNKLLQVDQIYMYPSFPTQNALNPTPNNKTWSHKIKVTYPHPSPHTPCIE